MKLVVICEHKSEYPNPISFAPDDALVLGRRDDEYPGWIWVLTPSGNEGWAPESLIRVTNPSNGVAMASYTSRELDTRVGEHLFNRRELSGWLWVENEEGKAGWIPKNTVRAT